MFKFEAQLLRCYTQPMMDDLMFNFVGEIGGRILHSSRNNGSLMMQSAVLYFQPNRAGVWTLMPECLTTHEPSRACGSVVPAHWLVAVAESIPS